MLRCLESRVINIKQDIIPFLLSLSHNIKPNTNKLNGNKFIRTSSSFYHIKYCISNDDD